MSSFLADLLIWALLTIGAFFGGIGLMGLLIFPDTKSRMFTAFRATTIALGAVVLAVVLYGYTLSVTTGGDLYPALILRALFLAVVLTSATWLMYGRIRTRTEGEKSEPDNHEPARPVHGTKDEE